MVGADTAAEATVDTVLVAVIVPGMVTAVAIEVRAAITLSADIVAALVVAAIMVALVVARTLSADFAAALVVAAIAAALVAAITLPVDSTAALVVARTVGLGDMAVLAVATVAGTADFMHTPARVRTHGPLLEHSVHLKSGTMFLGHEGTGCPAAHRELPQADSTGGGDAGIDVPEPGPQWMHG